MYTSIERHEMHYAKRYLEYEETDFYRAVRDKTNAHCHEANYAVLKSCDDAAATIAAVEAFYAWRGPAEPVLFRSAPDAVPVLQAGRVFSRFGYAVKPCHPMRLERTAQRDARVTILDCATKCIETVPDCPERPLLREALGGKEPLLHLLDTRIEAGAKAFFAYNKAGVPVSFCFGEGYGSAFRLSHLYTPVPCRRQGCATAVTAAALRYGEENGYTSFYMDACDKAVGHLLNRLGFRGKQVEAYWVCKGALPAWIAAMK